MSATEAISSILPKDYGYVFAGLFAVGVANTYLVVNVVRARTKFDIKPPILYATKEHINGKAGAGSKCKTEADVEKYNCAQRAHQNTVENLGTVLAQAVVTGLVFPRFAAACLGFFALGRIIYGYGYYNHGPKGRMAGGMITHLGDMPLFLGCAYTAYHLLKQ